MELPGNLSKLAKRVPNLLDPLADLGVLVRRGAIRPLGPRALVALGRQVKAEGAKAHLIYTIHGTNTPDAPALVFRDRVTSWGELNERLKRLVNHLLSSGLRPGDALAVLLPNRPEFIETQAAALRAGMVISFINPRAPVEDVASLLERTGAKLLVTHRDDLDTGVPVLRAGDDFEAAVGAAPSDEPPIPREAKGKIVIFTSGTTGRPKGAVRSLDDGASLKTLAGFLRTIPFRADDTHMVVCPLYHSSGSGFATAAQTLGNAVVLVEHFTPEAFCREVEQHRVTTTAVVPTMLHKLVDWDGARDHDLSSLRVVVCTGSPLRQDLRDRARDLLGDVIYDLYGSTEMAWVSVAGPADQRQKPGSVGKPVGGVSVRVLDPEGRQLPPGEIGEIWSSSGALMESYLDDPELTDERMRDGYVSVRDLGYLDADGYLYVVDRADDMIITGGVNVYPAETEIALSRHPAVSEVAVVGVPDPSWGQRIVAAVVPAGEVGSDELVAWCKERVAYAAVPKEVRMLDELPRNDIGKVDKKRIVQGWEP